MRKVVHFVNVELGCPLSETLSRAFRKGRDVHLTKVVLDCDQLFAWSACVGLDVDTSCSLVFMSVCKSGGRNPVPYQESRAV
jgi:hypothetical protein